MFRSPPSDTGLQKSKKKLVKFSVCDKGTFAIVLVTLSLVFVLVWFGIVVKQKVIEVEKQWLEYSNDAAVSAHVLSRFQANFGYGGFIHNFKNYVLRKDKALIPKIKNSLIETRLALKDYPLEGPFQDLDDKLFIEDLNNVLDKYSANFELARKLIEEGVSTNEIDRQVRINDTPALLAIEHLSQHATDHKNEYALETSNRLNSALNLINWGLLVIPLVLISGLLMFELLRKIKKVNHRLEGSYRFLSDLFEAAPDPMMIIDETGLITEVNQEACNLFGSTRKNLEGRTVESLMPQRFRKQHVKTREDSFNVTESRMLNSALELYALGKDNEEIPVEISLSYTMRDDKRNAIVTLRDITEKKRVEENIKHLAQYDQLTNLPNRALFDDRLKHAIDRAQRNKTKIGLMFVDLDGFKNINDSLGHQAGDELLIIIAERLSSVVRSEDTVARFGGDEFVIILEDLKHSDYAAIVAKKILKVVSDDIYLSSQEVRVGASIGISIFPDNGNDAINLINKADISMYQAKKHGKNGYKFFIKDYLS